MAKIEEHLLVIKLSRLVKDNTLKNKTTIADSLTPDALASLEQLVQELLGDGLVVEIEN
jgi:hypothetical protein